MSTVLLDTDIVSLLIKGNPDKVSFINPIIQNLSGAISFMTVAELYQWAFFNKWGERRLLKLEENIFTYLVLPFDVNLCRLWATVRAERRAMGRPISPQDAWITATALHYDLRLITNNAKDFQGIEGLRLIDPQEP